MSRRMLFGFLIIALMISVWGVSQQQRLRNYASYPQCPDNSAICRWDPQGAGIRYRYQLLDTTDNRTVAQGETTDWWFRFTPLVDHRYVCQVAAVNSCGVGPPSQVISMCSAVFLPTETPILPSPMETIAISPVPTNELAGGFLHNQSPPGQIVNPTDVPPLDNAVTPSVSPATTQNFPVMPIEKKEIPGWKDPALLTNVATYLLISSLLGTVGLAAWQQLRRMLSAKKPPRPPPTRVGGAT